MLLCLFLFFSIKFNWCKKEKKSRWGRYYKKCDSKRSVIAGSAFPFNFSVKAFYIWIRSCAFMSSVCQVKVVLNQQKLLCLLSPLEPHVMLLQKTKHQKTKTSAHNYGFWDTFLSPTLSPTKQHRQNKYMFVYIYGIQWTLSKTICKNWLRFVGEVLYRIALECSIVQVFTSCIYW